MNKKIGIIGYGNMGSAIVERIKGDYAVSLFDKDTAKTAHVPGVTVCGNAQELVSTCDAVILAVKPQDFAITLTEIKPALNADKVIISIAAGVTTSFIESRIGVCRVIRRMPNMPAQIGAGVTGITTGKFAAQEDIDLAEDLFEYVGEVIFVEESKMSAVTAVSGSGPAYVCYFFEKNNINVDRIPQDKMDYFIDAFIAAALNTGLEEDVSRNLVRSTYSGTVKYLKDTAVVPAELRRRVTSKGGTTEAAIAVLENGGALSEAVLAAARRAEELSQ